MEFQLSPNRSVISSGRVAGTWYGGNYCALNYAILAVRGVSPKNMPQGRMI